MDSSEQALITETFYWPPT